jgi:hypothetical protein
MAQVYLCVSYELFKAPKPTQGDIMYQRELPKSKPHFVVDKVGYVFVPDEKSRCKVSTELVGRTATINIKIKNVMTEQQIKLSPSFASKVKYLLSMNNLDFTYSFAIIDGPIGFDIVNVDTEVPFVIKSSLGSIVLTNKEISNIKKTILSQYKLDRFNLVFFKKNSSVNFYDALSWVTENYGSPKK